MANSYCHGAPCTKPSPGRNIRIDALFCYFGLALHRLIKDLCFNQTAYSKVNILVALGQATVDRGEPSPITLAYGVSTRHVQGLMQRPVQNGTGVAIGTHGGPAGSFRWLLLAWIIFNPPPRIVDPSLWFLFF